MHDNHGSEEAQHVAHHARMEIGFGELVEEAVKSKRGGLGGRVVLVECQGQGGKGTRHHDIPETKERELECIGRCPAFFLDAAQDFQKVSWGQDFDRAVKVGRDADHDGLTGKLRTAEYPEDIVQEQAAQKNKPV